MPTPSASPPPESTGGSPVALEELRNRLAAHDWFYYLSDDPAVAQRGRDEFASLQRMARALGVEGAKAFNDAMPKKL